MTIYITKWALSKGILAADVEPPGESGLVHLGWCWLYPDKYRTSLERAVVSAEDMRNREIARHYKRIKKLERMTFDEVKPL